MVEKLSRGMRGGGHGGSGSGLIWGVRQFLHVRKGEVVSSYTSRGTIPNPIFSSYWDCISLWWKEKGLTQRTHPQKLHLRTSPEALH